MNLLSAENLEKNYGLRNLFFNLNIGIDQGEKIALVAPNGSGKTTLMRILAGLEPPDSGKVVVRNGIRLGYLEQNPVLATELTIRQWLQTGMSEILDCIRQYHDALEKQSLYHNQETQKVLDLATSSMDKFNAWDYESRLEKALSVFRISNLDQVIGTLSGGQRKRLNLARLLVEEPDLLLLDEPTNHLDLDMIEWLEEYLGSANRSFLMVTHDRYFLDRVCNRILELDRSVLYSFQGNYSQFLEKKTAREEAAEAEQEKLRNLLRKELDWMRRMPKARTTKSKARIDAFYELKKKTDSRGGTKELKLEVSMARMGNSILEFKNVSKSFPSLPILNKFSYIFSKGERIGLIGKNGSGKTTFLNLIAGKEKPDQGEIITGETIQYGYYTQEGINLQEDKRVIDTLKEVAEVIELSGGRQLSASQMLQRFLFPSELQYNFVSALSGGERKRLQLLMVLMKNPNFLLLDEPTNDLDLQTMTRLEEFLADFKGSLILVSHDRYFIDRLTDHLFVMEGEGKILDYTGNYTEYKSDLEEYERQEREKKAQEKKELKQNQNQLSVAPLAKQGKLSYKEKLEWEKLEKEIPELENQKSELEQKMNSSAANYLQLQEISTKLIEINKLLEDKTNRWLELSERL